MKIGVLLDTEYTLDIRVLNEVNYLKNAGYEVHLLCPSFEKQVLFEILDGVSIHRFKLKKSFKNKLFGIMNTIPYYELFWIGKVKKFVKVVKPNFLHAHDLFMSKIAFKGGDGKIPIILDLHENFPEAIKAFRWATRFPHRLLSRPDLWKKKELEYLNYADKIIVLRQSFKENLTKRYPSLNSESIFIYPNVPDLRQMQNFSIKLDLFPKNGRYILFYYGGIGVRRGIYTCFEAVKILASKIPSIHLLLIGPVDRHEKSTFNRYLNDPILKEKVTYYDWRDLSDFPSYALSSDICLSPIIKDEQHESGVANKVFQYMLFQKPIIVSDCTPQIEIVERNQCGLVFESENAEDLAKKISYLFDNPELCIEMGKNGKKSVLVDYNLEVCGIQLDLLYKSINL
jgi:glycosyltransferase involved in cell wall biosynthesis